MNKKNELISREDLLKSLKEKRRQAHADFINKPESQTYYSGVLAGLLLAEDAILDADVVTPADVPTKKQIDFAQTIANTLGIELPKRYTKNAYRKFISDNFVAYNTKKSTFDVSDEEYSANGGIGIGFEHFCE